MAHKDKEPKEYTEEDYINDLAWEAAWLEKSRRYPGK